MKKNMIRALCLAAALMMSGCGASMETAEPLTALSEAETEEMTATAEESTEETTVNETAAAEETTTAEKTAELKKEASKIADTLSDDIYSFQLQLDGIVYQIPLTYADFTAQGWVYDGDGKEMLDSGYRAIVQVFDKGKLEVYADIMNFDINAKMLEECYIGGISINGQQLNGTGASAVLPKGIELGISTEEDIRNAYGTPSYEYKMDSGSVIMEYRVGSYEKVAMTVDGETKTLNDIKISNYVAPDDFETGEVSQITPDIVSKFTAPDAISDDFAEYTVQYGGNIYQLPAPVSVFEANGWKIVEDDTQMEVSGLDFGWVGLMKDNQNLKVIAQNYSEQATTIHNCFVTSVKSDKYSTKVPMTIAKGITIGMSKEDLESALSGVDYEKDDSSESYIYYEVVPGKSALDNYEILVGKDDGLVYKIEVSNAPKYNDFVNR